jgi:hypothetical protein
MASAVSGMRVVYDKEGIDPGKCMQCTVLPHITASALVKDDESGLHHDYEVWLGKLAPHAPIDQAGPEAGCTTAPERTPVLGEGIGCRRAPEAAGDGARGGRRRHRRPA